MTQSLQDMCAINIAKTIKSKQEILNMNINKQCKFSIYKHFIILKDQQNQNNTLLYYYDKLIELYGLNGVFILVVLSHLSWIIIILYQPILIMVLASIFTVMIAIDRRTILE